MKSLRIYGLFKFFEVCFFIVVVVQVERLQAEEMLEGNVQDATSTEGFLNVPLGANRKDLDVAGDWVRGSGYVSYKSKQSLLGYPFVVYTRFEGDVAVSARLVLRKYYDYQYYESRSASSGHANENGAVEAVYQYCFGERYGKFLSNALGAWGATTSPPISNSEDTSKKLSDAEQWCSESKVGDCQKIGKSSIKAVNFENSNKLIEFKAVLNEERRSARRADILTNIRHYTCVWVVNVSEK